MFRFPLANSGHRHCGLAHWAMPACGQSTNHEGNALVASHGKPRHSVIIRQQDTPFFQGIQLSNLSLSLLRRCQRRTTAGQARPCSRPT